MDKNKVRFVRIRGRVVPIKQKENYGSNINKGVSTVVGANVANLAITKKLMAPTISSNFNSLPEKYKSFLKEAGNPRLGVSNIIGAESRTIRSEFNPTLKRYSFKIDKAGKKYGSTLATFGSHKSEASFLHEIGHIKASRIKGTANYLGRKFSVMGIKDSLSVSKASKLNKLKIGLASILHSSSYTGPFIRLATEAEASTLAVKAAKQVGGTKHALRIAKSLILPYSTYALTATAAAGSLYTGYQIHKLIISKIKGFNKRKKGS